MYLRRNAIEKQIKNNGFFEVAIKRGTGETLFLKDIKSEIYAILVEDSIEEKLYSQNSIERMKRTVKNIIKIKDENILIVLLGNEYVDSFKSENSICINVEKCTVKHGRINIVFQSVLNNFKDLASYNIMQGESLSQQEQICRLEPKKVIMTYIILALNVFFFIKYGNNSYDTWGMSARKILEEGQTYRVFSYMFMHSGIIHLLNNSLSLIAIGIALEKRVGLRDFLTVYLISGFFASFVSLCYTAYWTGNVEYTTVGASGAILGLMGAYWVDYMMDSSVIKKKNVLLYFIIVLTFSSLGYKIDVMCHIGGFLGGAYIMYIINIVRLTSANNTFIKNMQKCNAQREFR